MHQQLLSHLSKFHRNLPPSRAQLRLILILLRHNSRHTPPEITSVTPSSFPRIRVDKSEVILQAWVTVHSLVVIYICLGSLATSKDTA